MRALYRYQREHYRKITVRRELYETLRRLADERGKTIPDLIKELIGTYIGGNTGSSPSIGTNIGGNIGSSPNIGGNIDTYIGGNIGGNTGASSATSPPPSTARSPATTGVKDSAETHIWCRKKSEIQRLEGFLEWVKHNYGLVDWWEEGDRYCFETKREPKRERGKKRGRGGGGG
jgi:hypothetical protein